MKKKKLVGDDRSLCKLGYLPLGEKERSVSIQNNITNIINLLEVNKKTRFSSGVQISFHKNSKNIFEGRCTPTQVFKLILVTPPLRLEFFHRTIKKKK